MKHGGISWLLLATLGFSACSGKTLKTVGVVNDGEAGMGLGGEPSSAGGGEPGVTPGGTQAAGGDPAQPLDSCDDGVENGTESDLDCGGSCRPCFEHQHCLVGGDCQSGECGGPFDDDTCEPLHCGNHQLDAGEGDIDCGGADCDRCEAGSHCSADRDCLDNSCQGGVCVYPCSTGANCQPSGVCEDGHCILCHEGDECPAGSNCDSASGNACLCRSGVTYCAAGCANGVKDGAETDIDCGGPTCAPCGLRGTCDAASDCASKLCYSHDFGSSITQCWAEHCANGVADEGESDVDCGGPECSVCAAGQACQGEDDCEIPQSCADNVCIKPCRASSAEICGQFSECIDDRCVDCQTTEDCNIDCGTHSSPVCKNQSCLCQ